MKTLSMIVLAGALLVTVAGAFAQGEALPAAPESPEKAEGPAAAAPQPQMAPEERVPMAKALAIVGACLGAGLCAVGGGFGIARIGGNCIESIARQPEAAGPMFTPMIITAAMVEGGMLFAIVVCMLGVLFI